MSPATLSTPPRTVAIIGAGLGGLTLALALKQTGISVQIHELRTPDYDIGGAIMLSPNALRVLDHLGAYSRLHTRGYNFDLLTFKNDADQKTTAIYHFGGQAQYGYRALRIYRKAIISELRLMAQEASIPITYGQRYSHVVSEAAASGVTFAFTDGTQGTADFLVGADGIHSTVRKHIHPAVHPAYSGFLGVSFAFPAARLRLPAAAQGEPEYPLPVNIQGKLGAFVMAPQDVDGREVFAGRQFRVEGEGSRAGWEALLGDRERLVAMLQGGMEEWSDVVRSGLEQAGGGGEAHGLSIWPFHVVPRMESWASGLGRVVIVGDAAHAIPPTAGQGANQAFEDAWSLAWVLGRLEEGMDLGKGLRVWQAYRQERIGKVLALSNEMNQMRLAKKDQDGQEGKEPEIKKWVEMEWLYSNVIEQDLIKEFEKVKQA